MSHSVAIIIPVHNRLDDTIECLRSLYKMDYADFEVTVVDDGSTDGTSQELARQYPQVRLLRGDGTLWWPKATNLGAEDALERGCRYVLFFNQDVVAAPQFLSSLVETAEANPSALVGPKVYYYRDPDVIWSAGGALDWLIKGIHHRGFAERDRGQFDDRCQAEWFTGMGLLVPAGVIQELGYVDAAAFPQLGAEADFSLRARRQGHPLIFEPRAKLWHKVGGLDYRTRRVPVRELARFFLQTDGYDGLLVHWRLYRRHCPWALRPLAFQSHAVYVAATLLKSCALSGPLCQSAGASR